MERFLSFLFARQKYRWWNCGYTFRAAPDSKRPDLVGLDLDAFIAKSWQRTVSEIPTTLGRLAYLSSLRDGNTGRYEHFGLTQRIGDPVEANRILRQSHVEVFQKWLCFGLEQQKQELETYFAELEGDRREIVSNWLTLKPYNNWFPCESRDVERKLFRADLEVILELFRIEYGV